MIRQEDGWFDLWFSNICYIGIICKFIKNTSSWAPPTDSGGLGGAREFQQVPRDADALGLGPPTHPVRITATNKITNTGYHPNLNDDISSILGRWGETG